MTFADGWTCWKGNRPQGAVCYRCKTPRDAHEAAIEATQASAAARAEQPDAVPDIVVALPAVIFRGYSRAWLRRGMGVIGCGAGIAAGAGLVLLFLNRAR